VVADLLEGETLGDKVGSARVTQRVRSEVGSADAEPPHPLADPGIQSGSRYRPERRNKRQEDLARRRYRPYFPEITDERVTNRRG
jgi:hypothetical protein